MGPSAVWGAPTFLKEQKEAVSMEIKTPFNDAIATRVGK